MAERRDDFGEDIQRLVSAVQEWARRATQPGPGAASGAGSGAGSGATSGVGFHAGTDALRNSAGLPGQCLPWCPICQFANLLRGEHPELTERLGEAANAVTAAMKALAEVSLARAQHESEASRDRPRPGPRVQRIRLDDAAAERDAEEQGPH